MIDSCSERGLKVEMCVYECGFFVGGGGGFFPP